MIRYKYNMDYLETIQDKEQFVHEIKQDISKRVFAELEKKKQELANDFIKSEEDESE